MNFLFYMQLQILRGKSNIKSPNLFVQTIKQNYFDKYCTDLEKQNYYDKKNMYP